MRKPLKSALAICLLAASCSHGVYRGWPEYLGGPDRNHYSTLSQITPENVHQLEIAWTYSMPDSGQVQTNPIVADGILYGITPSVQAFALNAATGEEIWRFGEPLMESHNTGRGVAYWTDGREKRIFHTIGPRLYAIDAQTGAPVESFGNGGYIDLHLGLPEIAAGKYINSNTPGTIFEDLIIMPVRLSEGSDAAPGDIRAFNVRTGELAWVFHTIPYPGEFGYETFPEDAWQNTYTGAANNWSGMSVDRKRGVLYVPTGSAAYDFYGGNRPGENLFSDCLLALDARTGKRIWHYQFVHHDIWDRDLPAPPNLITLNHNGRRVDAVAQVTKQGYVFVFNRETGEPLFDIREIPVPTSDLPGEVIWPTQPVPVKPAPFARMSTSLTEADIPLWIADRGKILETFKACRKEQWAPPSREGTLLFPGYDGAAEWGGAAVDVETGVMYVNSNEMAWIMQMVEVPGVQALMQLSPGERIYASRCSSCHGQGRMGNPASGYPALNNLNGRLEKSYVSGIIASGKGKMPGINLNTEEKEALIRFLYNEESTSGEQAGKEPGTARKDQVPFVSTGYNKFLDANGLPAFSPPYGSMTAIDLNTGEHLWRIVLGEDPKLKKMGISNTGTENYGGPVVTRNGLLFIAATKDGKFRAFDKQTGRLLWETDLPAASFATPATYEIHGRQYIVLACGGTKLDSPKGNKYVAYALPEQ
jgi:quinoprotein glucose dehydrogenase